MSEKITVGRFTYEDGVVTGPADYMKERGNARLRSIEAGTDVVFNVGMGLDPYPGSWLKVDGPQSPNAETAILVSLQTDYAGYLGEKQMEAALAS